MNPIPQILLAEFLTWQYLAKRPIDFIQLGENMPVSLQSELIQVKYVSVCKELNANGFELDSEEFISACSDFEEEQGLENILFLILSDFEKDNPELPDFGKVLLRVSHPKEKP